MPPRLRHILAEDIKAVAVVDLEKFDAIGPVHTEGFCELADNVAVCSALYAPVDFVEDPDIG